jgi:hypothetical protein
MRRLFPNPFSSAIWTTDSNMKSPLGSTMESMMSLIVAAEAAPAEAFWLTAGAYKND